MSDSSSALSGSGSDNAYASEQEDVPDVGMKTDGIGTDMTYTIFIFIFLIRFRFKYG